MNARSITRRSVIASAIAGSSILALGVATPAEAASSSATSSASVTAAAASTKYLSLRLGDHENDFNPVVTAQYLLRRWTPTLKVDGSFGYGTQAAVKKFQTAERLPVTGSLVTNTEWERLLLRSAVRPGSTGNAVVALQRELNDWIGPVARPLVLDGSYGTRTTNAVKIYQQGVNDRVGYTLLRVDGIAGPASWNYLMMAHD